MVVVGSEGGGDDGSMMRAYGPVIQFMKKDKIGAREDSGTVEHAA